MAKKSLKVKQQKPQKYATREYNRCKICGRPHAYIRKFGICRVCFRELAHKGEIPASKLKLAIAQILLDEGYIKSFEKIEDGKQGMIQVTLKYDEKGKRVISGLKRISKPGLRIYVSCEELPQVLNGLGIALVSTSKGIKTDRDARREGLGGEVLAYVW